MSVPDISTQCLEPQQILKAFDEYWEKFQWRYQQDLERLEKEAYRQLTKTLVAQLNAARHVNEKLEHVFKVLGINPREQKAWAEKINV